MMGEAHGGPPPGIDLTHSEAWVEHPDGRRVCTDFSGEASPAEGYVAIEDFMSRHLEAHEDFTVGMIEQLLTLDFQVVHPRVRAKE